MSELELRKIPLILVTPHTRAEVEPFRRKIGHGHPFIVENGGGIFFPDGYFNVRIPGAVRNSRYLCIAQGKPYPEVCEALDDIAQECGVGVAGFHHMSLREIADNSGLRPRDAEQVRSREFEELFYFTSADEAGIARFVEAARLQGYTARQGGAFWHFSHGCDPARAVRNLTELFREATRTKLRSVGIGVDADDLVWLRATDQAIMLPGGRVNPEELKSNHAKNIITGNASGPAGWSEVISDIIS